MNLVIPVILLKEEMKKIGVSLVSNKHIAQMCKVIIIAVKPNTVQDILEEIKNDVTDQHLIISIAAGIQIGVFENILPKNTRIVRVMPNVNCLVLSSASAFCMSKAAKRGVDDVITREIFSSVGLIEECEESLLDAVTGLSGSGPAYVFNFIEALADGGVRSGLPRDIAMRLAAQTVLGSAKMLMESKKHPGELKDMVTSPVMSN
jgi:pyrroline-5-carboxylate reductase